MPWIEWRRHHALCFFGIYTSSNFRRSLYFLFFPPFFQKKRTRRPSPDGLGGPASSETIRLFPIHFSLARFFVKFSRTFPNSFVSFSPRPRRRLAGRLFCAFGDVFFEHLRWGGNLCRLSFPFSRNMGVLVHGAKGEFLFLSRLLRARWSSASRFPSGSKARVSVSVARPFRHQHRGSSTSLLADAAIRRPGFRPVFAFNHGVEA